MPRYAGHFLFFLKNRLRALVDSVGTAIRGYDGYIYIPNLEEKLVKFYVFDMKYICMLLYT